MGFYCYNFFMQLLELLALFVGFKPTSTNARDVVDCHYSPEDFQFPAVVKLPDNIMDRFEIILESSGDGLTIALQGESEPIAFKLLEKLQSDLRLDRIDENNLIEYVFAV